jgi:hypothetical protein
MEVIGTKASFSVSIRWFFQLISDILFDNFIVPACLIHLRLKFEVTGLGPILEQSVGKLLHSGRLCTYSQTLGFITTFHKFAEENKPQHVVLGPAFIDWLH